MKRLLSIVWVIALCVAVMTGCGSESTNSGKSSGKMKIVTTIFPEYDWVMNILGDESKNADVTMLLDNGVDLHSYQPTADDIMKIATCDMFIYVGGESDGWVEDVIAQAVNKDMIVINLLEVLGDKVKEEEIVEGMEAEEEEEGEKESEVEYDEHVWLSLNNANLFCEEIAGKLCDADVKNADKYKANLAAYTEKISKLDSDYKNMIEGSKRKTILFGDRFPFRYMVDDYGLEYYAAFVGCSAETEASFETVVFLAKKVDEYKLPVIMTIEGSDNKIAETIKENTASKNQEIVSIDSMQSVTSKDIKAGVSYLNIMSENMKILESALY
ncbi:MAG: zinc ABC transporter substrate-binding protein [Lachnospiraceae bacterium]|nr:zinc ABC transporter substrate-binding protein [Lachnospiraceae bacterium]